MSLLLGSAGIWVLPGYLLGVAERALRLVQLVPPSIQLPPQLLHLHALVLQLQPKNPRQGSVETSLVAVCGSRMVSGGLGTGGLKGLEFGEQPPGCWNESIRTQRFGAQHFLGGRNGRFGQEANKARIK